MAQEKTRGTVKFYNSEKGFGFIICTTEDGVPVDVFVHKSNIIGEIQQHDTVELNVEKTEKGLSAMNVCKV